MAKGFVAITVERCKGCGFCVEFCPTHVLALSSAFNSKGYHPPHVSAPRNAAAATCAVCTVPISQSLEHGMHADPKGVLTGVHFLDGDHACCEGTLAAGARFAAGYPITPSTEVVERFASRIPTVGGHLHSNGRRTGRFHRHPGRGLGRRQSLHGHLRPGLLADDGAHRLRRHDRDAVRFRECAARRTVHGPADAAGAGRHDAGAAGVRTAITASSRCAPIRRRSAST